MQTGLDVGACDQTLLRFPFHILTGHNTAGAIWEFAVSVQLMLRDCQCRYVSMKCSGLLDLNL
jgi:hypothetical protein